MPVESALWKIVTLLRCCPGDRRTATASFDLEEVRAPLPLPFLS